MTDEIIKHQLVLDKISEYFSELNYHNQVVYGSFIERMHGFEVDPNDIDVTIVVDGEPPEPRHKTFYLGFSELPINVEFMNRESFEAELISMQPKYFMCMATAGLAKDIDMTFKKKELHEVRSCISSITSKAFDKGKKKLTVENDYDEVLGLKNLYHAFKFPCYANWFYIGDEQKEVHIRALNNVHKMIYEIYKESTGTHAERCAKLLEIIKPMHNALMTDFRIQFPKKVD